MTVETRIAVWRTVLTAVGLLLLIAPAAAQKPGGSITVGLELDIPGLDPVKVGVYDTAAEMAAALIFDTLTSLDDKGDPVPRLAESWTHSDDFKTWTFRLRAGVKFHDGTPFNAAAVAWNLARQKDPSNHCRCAFYVQNIDKVEAVDELTAVFRLRDPSVNFAALVAPPAVSNVVHSPSAIQTLGDDYNRKPVGTGPFVLKSWTAGDRMVVERNPDYWNKGRPYLDRVVLRPLPDSQARFASLQSGEADLVWDDEYDADNIIKAQGDPSLAVHAHTGSGAQVYAFNTKVAPFDDPRVRRALVMAIDRRKMSQALTN
ncbi:MAG: ABC transporter substrate-binding protein, partial [Xanthobacteraceae bacterium]